MEFKSNLIADQPSAVRAWFGPKETIIPWLLQCRHCLNYGKRTTEMFQHVEKEAWRRFLVQHMELQEVDVQPAANLRLCPSCYYRLHRAFAAHKRSGNAAAKQEDKVEQEVQKVEQVVVEVKEKADDEETDIVIDFPAPMESAESESSSIDGEHSDADSWEMLEAEMKELGLNAKS